MYLLAQSNAAGQLSNILSALASPLGVVSLLAFVAVTVFTIVSPTGKWFVLGIALWGSSLAPTNQDDDLPSLFSQTRLIAPLTVVQDNGRLMTAALLLSLAVPAIMAPKGRRVRTMPGGTLALFVFQLVYSFRFIAAGYDARGYAGAAIFTLNLIVLGIGLTRWLQSIDDVHAMLRSFALASGLYCTCVTIQLVVGAGAIMAGNRLTGLNGNANGAAQFLAIAIPVLCYLLLQPTESKLLKFVYGALLGLSSLFLGWTGSRGGLLLAGLALVILLRFRVKKIALVTIVGGIFLTLAAQLLLGPEATGAFGRMIDTSYTRQGIAEKAWDAFTANPIAGLSGGDTGFVENSYLAVAQRFGLIGIVPMLITIGVTTAGLIGVWRRRRSLGEHALVADLTIAALVSIAVAAFFEAFLLATSSMPIYAIYCYQALIALILDLGQTRSESIDAGVYAAEGGEPVIAHYGSTSNEFQ